MTGYWLARGDYSQIEARVNPWLAGATWKLDAFRAYDAATGPDLYRVTAAGILTKQTGRGILPAEVSKAQRQSHGKVSELALGFQGGVAAFLAMAKAYGVRIAPADAEEIKVGWRATNREIVGLWHGLNYAAIECMESAPGDVIEVWAWDHEGDYRWFRVHKTPLTFMRTKAALSLRLPSGRRLLYWSAKLRDVPTPWGYRPAVIYRGEDSVTKRWAEFTGYGGLYCENAVQATARDLMADALLKLDDAGLRPLLTVHDEAVCLLPRMIYPTAADAAAAVESIMRNTPDWAQGLPVAADASAADRYVKG